MFSGAFVHKLASKARIPNTAIVVRSVFLLYFDPFPRERWLGLQGHPCGRSPPGARISIKWSILIPFHGSAGWGSRGSPAGGRHSIVPHNFDVHNVFSGVLDFVYNLHDWQVELVGIAEVS